MAVQPGGSPAPFEYRIFPLTYKEFTTPGCTGLRYAMMNKDRWLNCDHAAYEMQTYDRGFTSFVQNGKHYQIHCDYILNDDEIRLYICHEVQNEFDDYSEEAIERYEKEQEELAKKYGLKIKDRYDYRTRVNSDGTGSGDKLPEE